MQNLYLFVERSKSENCIKYGMKLSEYTDKVISIDGTEKKGITAYLAPKDSEKYVDENYVCLKIITSQNNVLIYNKAFEYSSYFKENVCKVNDYILGSYEEPVALICSSVLPEHVYLYNEKIDSPLIIQDSKDYYYSKSIYEILESDIFTNYEIFQTLLHIGKHTNQFSFLEKFKVNYSSEEKEVIMHKKLKRKFVLKN